jgi:hypothetical protein
MKVWLKKLVQHQTSNSITHVYGFSKQSQEENRLKHLMHSTALEHVRRRLQRSVIKKHKYGGAPAQLLLPKECCDNFFLGEEEAFNTTHNTAAQHK